MWAVQILYNLFRIIVKKKTLSAAEAGELSDEKRRIKLGPLYYMNPFIRDSIQRFFHCFFTEEIEDLKNRFS